MTQDTLAAKSGVSKPFISQIENGTRGYTYATLRKIADALGIGIADLFDDTTTPTAVLMDGLSDVMEKLEPADQRQVLEYAAFLAQKHAAKQTE